MKIDEARMVARTEAGAPPVTARAAVTLSAVLDEIERTCDNMNRGEPGWVLRDKIRAVIAGEREPAQ